MGSDRLNGGGGTEPLRPSLSIVIPVFRGGKALTDMVAEIIGLETPYELAEVVLVHDCGAATAVAEMKALAERYAVVTTLWLSRNAGQHAATMAGFSATTGDWVVSLDEDGMFDPATIPQLLSVAERERSALVYGRPSRQTPHPWWRNFSSRAAKAVAEKVFGLKGASDYSSFRLIRGEIARGTAAYATYGQYLDVALGWFTERVATAAVEFRENPDQKSSYGPRRLLHHFRMMVLTSGPRPLRFVGSLGLVAAAGGFAASIVLIILQMAGDIALAGWTSLAVVTLIVGGLILMSLAALAEYVGLTVGLLLGRPAFLLLSHPSDEPPTGD